MGPSRTLNRGQSAIEADPLPNDKYKGDFILRGSQFRTGSSDDGFGGVRTVFGRETNGTYETDGTYRRAARRQPPTAKSQLRTGNLNQGRASRTY
jgi:hypothetical protein